MLSGFGRLLDVLWTTSYIDVAVLLLSYRRRFPCWVILSKRHSFVVLFVWERDKSQWLLFSFSIFVVYVNTAFWEGLDYLYVSCDLNRSERNGSQHYPFLLYIYKYIVFVFTNKDHPLARSVNFFNSSHFERNCYIIKYFKFLKYFYWKYM